VDILVTGTKCTGNAGAAGIPTLNNLACVGNIGVEGGAMTLVERRMHAGNWPLSWA
jgi:hypothetical protein